MITLIVYFLTGFTTLFFVILNRKLFKTNRLIKILFYNNTTLIKRFVLNISFSFIILCSWPVLWTWIMYQSFQGPIYDRLTGS